MELEGLHGFVVRRAAPHGLAVPMSEAVYAILQPWAVRNQRPAPAAAPSPPTVHLSCAVAGLVVAGTTFGLGVRGPLASPGPASRSLRPPP
jgi:hypothetical protein